MVGAGIVGICTALSLQDKGFQVELIDRAPPASGASFGNAGVISPWSCVPQSMPGIWKMVPKWLLDPEGPLALRWTYAPRMLPWLSQFLQAGARERLPAIADAMNALNRPNVRLYQQHLRGTGQENLLADSMYVHAFRNREKLDIKALAWQLRRERGVPLEVVEQGELQDLEPELSAEYTAAILIKNQARATDPGALGQALMEKSRQQGAQLRQTDVLALKQTTAGWCIETSDGPVNAERLVVAAGAWSARLLKPLGLSLPLEAERGYHLTFSDPGIKLNNSIMDGEHKFVVSSMLEGVRCAGTAEFAGLDAKPNYARAQVFKRLGKNLLPNLNTSDAEQWMGSRPSFPDSLPVISDVPGKPGLTCAFGHCHYGLGMAPNTGRIVADMVSGEPSDIDLSPYRIDRF